MLWSLKILLQYYPEAVTWTNENEHDTILWLAVNDFSDQRSVEILHAIFTSSRAQTQFNESELLSLALKLRKPATAMELVSRGARLTHSVFVELLSACGDNDESTTSCLTMNWNFAGDLLSKEKSFVSQLQSVVSKSEGLLQAVLRRGAVQLLQVLVGSQEKEKTVSTSSPKNNWGKLRKAGRLSELSTSFAENSLALSPIAQQLLIPEDGYSGLHLCFSKEHTPETAEAMSDLLFDAFPHVVLQIVDAVTPDGDTALMLAARLDARRACARLLKDFKADPAIVNAKTGENALHCSFFMAETQIIGVGSSESEIELIKQNLDSSMSCASQLVTFCTDPAATVGAVAAVQHRRKQDDWNAIDLAAICGAYSLYETLMERIFRSNTMKENVARRLLNLIFSEGINPRYNKQVIRRTFERSPDFVAAECSLSFLDSENNFDELLLMKYHRPAQIAGFLERRVSQPVLDCWEPHSRGIASMNEIERKYVARLDGEQPASLQVKVSDTESSDNDVENARVEIKPMPCRTFPPLDVTTLVKTLRSLPSLSEILQLSPTVGRIFFLYCIKVASEHNQPLTLPIGCAASMPPSLRLASLRLPACGADERLRAALTGREIEPWMKTLWCAVSFLCGCPQWASFMNTDDFFEPEVSYPCRSAPPSLVVCSLPVSRAFETKRSSLLFMSAVAQSGSLAVLRVAAQRNFVDCSDGRLAVIIVASHERRVAKWPASDIVKFLCDFRIPLPPLALRFASQTRPDINDGDLDQKCFCTPFNDTLLHLGAMSKEFCDSAVGSLPGDAERCVNFFHRKPVDYCATKKHVRLLSEQRRAIRVEAAQAVLDQILRPRPPKNSLSAPAPRKRTPT